jgi:glutamine amidotransferase
MITIIDYGLGNLGSIKNILKRIGVLSCVSSDPNQIKDASKLILPGVGAYDSAMLKLKEKSLIEVLNHKARVDRIPILGICLGMQLLLNASEEGNEKGLGWISGYAKRFQFQNNELKVPHMGWNYVSVTKTHPVTYELDGSKFYFVHSFHAVLENPEDCLLTTTYGNKFQAAICKDNIIGVQFHPEKSHKFGIKLLENFSKI